ncbi:MAG: hypothetical protein ACFFD9_00835 [Candidatus Thorarchaeota archaeon]
MSEFFTLKLCSDKTAFEAKAKVPVALDLKALADEASEKTGLRIRVSLPVLLLLEGDDGRRINIFPSGRLLLRRFPSREEAESAVGVLAPLLYQPTQESGTKE